LNKIGKGYRVEKRCADELKALGYLTWKTIRIAYCNIDLFGLFDIAGLHPQGKHILFIQVKTNKADNETRDRIRALRLPTGCQKWIWIWKDRRGWIKEFYK
jgi:hypothetical protein